MSGRLVEPALGFIEPPFQRLALYRPHLNREIRPEVAQLQKERHLKYVRQVLTQQGHRKRGGAGIYQVDVLNRERGEHPFYIETQKRSQPLHRAHPVVIGLAHNPQIYVVIKPFAEFLPVVDKGRAGHHSYPGPRLRPVAHEFKAPRSHGAVVGNPKVLDKVEYMEI